MASQVTSTTGVAPKTTILDVNERHRRAEDERRLREWNSAARWDVYEGQPFATKLQVWSDEDWPVAAVSACEDAPRIARLISAAPQLLAALREFVRTANGIERVGATPNWLADLSDNLNAARTLLAEIRDDS